MFARFLCACNIQRIALNALHMRTPKFESLARHCSCTRCPLTFCRIGSQAKRGEVNLPAEKGWSAKRTYNSPSSAHVIKRVGHKRNAGLQVQYWFHVVVSGRKPQRKYALPPHPQLTQGLRQGVALASCALKQWKVYSIIFHLLQSPGGKSLVLVVVDSLQKLISETV